MKKTFDAETILNAAIMLNRASRVILLAGTIRISAINKVRKASNGMWGVVHSLESHWVDKCDPLAVHSALLGLAEYRDGLSDDAPR